MLVVWGDKDNLAPSTGPVGKHLKARFVAATRFEESTNVGHVPATTRPQERDPGGVARGLA